LDVLNEWKLSPLAVAYLKGITNQKNRLKYSQFSCRELIIRFTYTLCTDTEILSKDHESITWNKKFRYNPFSKRQLSEQLIRDVNFNPQLKNVILGI